MKGKLIGKEVNDKHYLSRLCVFVPSDHKGLRIRLVLSEEVPGLDLCGKES
jgi:hypothetical protein